MMEKKFMKLIARLATVLTLVLSMSYAHAEVTTDVICSYAPSQSAAVKRISGLLAASAAGAEVALVTSGITIVAHSSGVPILTGAGGYIAGTMTGALATTTVITAGIIVGGSAVTVELACAPKNHPELVKKVIEDAKEYTLTASNEIKNGSVKWIDISKDKLNEFTDQIEKYQTITKDKIYELMGETWYQKAIRKTKESLGIS